MRLINVVRYRDANIGDHWSSPVHYFLWLTNAQQLDPYEEDFSQFRLLEQCPDVVLVGGGGQITFARTQWDKNLEMAVQSRAFSIAWSIGHNRHGARTLRYPAYLKHFDMVGLRDWGSPFPWVPCASCLHPLFDRLTPVIHDVVLYEHWQITTGIIELPTLRNNEPSIEKVLDLLVQRIRLLPIHITDAIGQFF